MVIRARSHPSSVAPEITAAIHRLDPAAPVLRVQTMDDLLAGSIGGQRLNALLLAAFAGLALLLAAIGIYSVLAYAVRRRARKIGVRMALGAQASDVLRLAAAAGLKPTLLGIAIGWAGALALSRVVANLVFSVKTTDVATFASVSAVLGVVALAACVVPAYRATKVDPMVVLRHE